MNQETKKLAVLKNIEQIGLNLKAQCDPGYYSYEYRSRAAQYQPSLEATRLAWKYVNANQDPVKVLIWLQSQIKPGIDYNKIARILDCLNPNNTNSWHFGDDLLITCK